MMIGNSKLYKGYVPTKDKRCMMSFKDKDSSELLTFEQADRLDEYAGILAEDAVLVDVDDMKQSEILMDIVEEKQLACRVYSTIRGKHFLFRNAGRMDTCKTHATLAVGVVADIKLGCRNSYEVLKYDGKEREIIYDIEEDEEYDIVPLWLMPVKTNSDFLGMGEGDGRNQALFNYILTLQNAGFSQKDATECIRLLNSYVLKVPLDEREIETILRNESFQKPAFFKGKTFLFDKFAKYLMNQHNIVKINRNLHVFVGGVYVQGYDIIEREMISHIPDLNQAKRKEVLAYLEICAPEVKPSSANLVAFANGVYDITTDELMPFSPDIVITNKINHAFRIGAYSEIVDRMLDKLAVGDSDIRMLLEEVVGYCFMRRNELRKAFVFLGEKHNGKSTYLDMINNLLGMENTSALDLRELGDKFKTAELFGKLANIGDDIGDEFVANPAIFKKVVSGDRVNAERKNKDPFEFNNYAKMLFSANNIPRIKDKSGAVLDRLIIVPFNASFTNKDADFDPYIKYKLRSEECMEYLIQLGIAGLKRVLENRGFTVSKKVEAEIKEYEANNNPVILFFEDLSYDDIVNQPTKTVYRRYSEFCLANNFQPMSNVEFSKQVKKRYNVDIILKRIKNDRVRIFVPLR